jgi:aldehyde dehydrogenase (NAD(P)+)
VTDREGIDRALRTLADNRVRWARLPIGTKLDYVREIRQRVVDIAEEWVQVGIDHKGLEPRSPLVGAEEWLGGPYSSLTWLTDMARTLSLLESGGDLLQGMPIRAVPRHQVAVRVQPGSMVDRLLTPGTTLDVWMQPGVTEWNLRETMARFYRQSAPSGRVLAVLGAGNYSALPFSDTVYYLFGHGDVVLLKMNPVNEAFQPVLATILQPLVRDGYLRFARGGAEAGEYLTRHDLVGAVHITGSAATHDAIVFGTGQEGARRKAADEPLIDKPVYSELGGVGPTIVVPGPWSRGDVAYQGEHIASQALHNAGHACVSAQVLVMPSQWSERDHVEAAVRNAFHTSTARNAYYPGTRQRQDELHEHSPQAQWCGGASRRTLLLGLDPTSKHPAFTQELFGPMLASTHLDGADPLQFLRNAVTFANERLYGSLGANILIHPATARKLGPDLIRAIADLRYGNIAINTWSAAISGTGRGAWGAYPGHSRTDIQSGTGVVRNTLLFDRPQKNVIRAPFRQYPRPVWFLNNPTATPGSRAFFFFLAKPSPAGIIRMVAAAGQR